MKKIFLILILFFGSMNILNAEGNRIIHSTNFKNDNHLVPKTNHNMGKKGSLNPNEHGLCKRTPPFNEAKELKKCLEHKCRNPFCHKSHEKGS